MNRLLSLDETRYQKYFARRTAKSHWFEKNKGLAQSLIAQGKMTRQGMDAIERARRTGAWDAPARARIDDEQVREFTLLVQPYEPAYSNLLAMPPSVHRTYAGYFLEAKNEKTRQSRLERIVDRLNQNLRPM